jgi:hypothetical protein
MNLKNPELSPGDLGGDRDDYCGCGDVRCPVCYPDSAAPPLPYGEREEGGAAAFRNYAKSKADPYDHAWGDDQ